MFSKVQNHTNNTKSSKASKPYKKVKQTQTVKQVKHKSKVQTNITNTYKRGKVQTNSNKY